MKAEIEVKFSPIEREKVIDTLYLLWAKLVLSNTLMKRAIFAVPHHGDNSRIRVRDEWSKITLSYKTISDQTTIDGVQELELIIDSFDKAIEMLTILWYRKKAYQESYREKRLLNECEICIDERPGLSPFIEIEWNNEQNVMDLSAKLGFCRDDALFGAVNTLYVKFLWYDHDELNEISEITFDKPLYSKL